MQWYCNMASWHAVKRSGCTFHIYLKRLVSENTLKWERQVDLKKSVPFCVQETLRQEFTNVFWLWNLLPPPQKKIQKKKRRLQTSCFLYVFPWKDKARYYMACVMTAIHHLHQLRVMLRSLKPEATWIRFSCCEVGEYDEMIQFLNKKFGKKHVYSTVGDHTMGVGGWGGDQERATRTHIYIYVYYLLHISPNKMVEPKQMEKNNSNHCQLPFCFGLSRGRDRDVE